MESKSQHDSPELDHLETTKQYFIRVDAGRADTVDLFTEDAQIYFPKFGIARGKAAFGELASGLFKRVSKLSHDLSTFTYVVTPDVIVVEGKTQGMDVEGRRWSGGETPGGRFCSVFEFRGPLICRMHIYLDPDYTSRDEDRFLWGQNRNW
jgi:SnoaL-like domain